MTDSGLDTDFELAPSLAPTGDRRGSRRPAPAARGALESHGESLLSDLQQAIDDRRRAEQALVNEFGAVEDAQERSLRRALDQLASQRESELTAIDTEYAAAVEQLRNQSDSEIDDARSWHDDVVREIERRYGSQRDEVERTYHDSSWVVSSVLDDTAEDSPRRQFERFRQLRERSREQQVADWEALDAGWRALVEERGWRASPVSEPAESPRTCEDAQTRFGQTIDAARNDLSLVRGLTIPRLFTGYRSLGLFAGVWLALFFAIFLVVDPGLARIAGGRMEPLWIGISAGGSFAAAVVLVAVVYTLGSMQQADVMRRIETHLAEAGWLHQRWLALAKQEYQQQQKQFEVNQAGIEKQRTQALQRYEQTHAERRSEIERGRTQELHAERKRFAEQHAALESAREQQLARAEQEYHRGRGEAVQRLAGDETRLRQELERHVQTRQRRQAEAWHALKIRWDSGVQKFQAGVSADVADSRRQFPGWEAVVAETWTPPTEIPAGLRLGEFEIDFTRWEGAVPDDVRLAPRATRSAIPAVLPFPEAGSLLLKVQGGAGRAAAVQALQVAMLRLLTLVPPGKLRFTILDPVGLGESFAGFMHLADYDELLVTSRIWTESGHIEERLADLTTHMENVLQKYLRNEFATIEEYNEFAGEVAEPYQILVVTDFPAKFTEIAARRLVSIVGSGPRCGVYTLLSVDMQQPLPHHFHLASLEEQVATFVWRDGALRMDASGGRTSTSASRATTTTTATEADLEIGPIANGHLCRWPLRIDAPPPPETFTAVVKRVGAASKDARRVEVAFERIAPPPDKLWSQSSRKGIDIPLGRAGATKLQHLRLGHGTSQHMLIAGKTGSGKSTFLHCLITNVALHYSPEEVRFYLIDFKKGVEFKDYATYHLPHAEVIAIESDREFGVSALARLDEVLKERGELFRRHGVQDLAGYREANNALDPSLARRASVPAETVHDTSPKRERESPTTLLPRILLVVDEFQEFFVEDDKHSQTAALLLDRLVRQGRAFGIHVVLGSQTLGGAYSLARSTLGQVAVRVALQCSESDAHLILSEENTAARLLTRPGEAIYNDANGLLEGNHPFQIAWLPDHQREEYLRRIRQLSERSGTEFEPPIVFEGNVPSDPARNLHLTRLIESASLASAAEASGTLTAGATSPAAAPRIWLGEAVEIKQPTSVTFHRQTGSNLLLVGPDPAAAYGIMATAAVTLVAQAEQGRESRVESRQQTTEQPTPSTLDSQLPSLFLLDGSPLEAAEAGAWRDLAARFPDHVHLAAPRDTGDVLARLAAEKDRRDGARDEAHPPLWVLVYNLSRFRDLRKPADDFGLGSFGESATDKPADPGRQFADLLAGGPECGIHVLVWCDSYNNLERWVSRQSLRDLEYRVAFQMNASDSSNLLDSPAASKLGVHRALLYREETGTSEKFRPYGAPAAGWLDGVAARLRTGAAVEPATDRQPAKDVEPAADLEPATDLDAFNVQ